MKFTRRRFVAMGGGATASLFLAERAGAESSQEVLVGGTLIGPPSPRSAVVETADGRTVQIVLAPEAKVSRGHFGRLTDLTSFVRGEDVVADVESDGALAVASNFQSIYYKMEGTVVRIDGQVAVTSDGNMYLPSEAEREQYSILRAIPDVRPGDSFEAQIWHEPGVPHRRVVSLRLR